MVVKNISSTFLNILDGCVFAVCFSSNDLCNRIIWISEKCLEIGSHGAGRGGESTHSFVVEGDGGVGDGYMIDGRF